MIRTHSFPAPLCGWSRMGYLLVTLVAVAAMSEQGSAQEIVPWTQLPEHVAGRLVPLDELSVRECPETLDRTGTAHRTVLQYIENVVYQWAEYDLEKGYCIILEEPDLGPLSPIEAQVLLSASRLWTEAIPATSDIVTLDPSDPRLNLPYSAADRMNGLPTAGTFGGHDGDDDVGVTSPSLLDYEPPGAVPSGSTSDARPEQLGNDSRVLITNTTSFPWRTIAFVSNEFNGSPFRGTAFLVAPKMALTNGHIVYNPERGGFASSLEIAPGQSQSSFQSPATRPFGQRAACRLRTNTTYTSIVNANIDDNSQFGYDYAAIAFSTPFNGISTFMPLVFDQNNRRVNLAGYPAMVRGLMTSGLWGSFVGDVVQVTPNLIAYQNVSSGGNSGGPVWLFDGQSQRVIAIHAFGSGIANGGPRLVSSNRELITGWMTDPNPCGSGPPTQPPPSSSCACRSNVNNFCLYPSNTPGCPMTAPGGYCTGNTNWQRGFSEYQSRCGGGSPPPTQPPPPSCGNPICDFNWCGTPNENNCPSSFRGTNDGCDCGCQFVDPDCS